ncbi:MULTISPECIES: DUF3307 domain-containing protein [Parabacteroides]|uniref:DUF3307 domain-containing protein n=3 Tax=Parabacteroides goldsteinii TaxID=328812 RepID=A0A6G1ZD77_9BACT|nr:DUF3307 domain-containing protein [Parabacteroides goldsteinii]TFU72610.1 DUF3307 domain-containing protein [Parabacteroides sp. P14]MBS6576917.1 DUF3307 domain-containing protein [Parabacteroides goldsteinii]MRX93972.1 DUF3307 domain-containing protein [Parabacteroides goldsteinii]MRX97302.1 DUF3307 domain-containing protein [Parabacteroides goldsteinii]
MISKFIVSTRINLFRLFSKNQPKQVVIFITHFAIDLWKITQKEKLYSFIIDQVLHILVLAFYSSGKCYLVLSYPRNSQTYPLLLSERRDFRHENKIKLQDYSHFDQYITSGAVVLAGILAERIV